MFWGQREKYQKEEKALNGKINNNDITITRYLTDGLLAFDNKNRLFLANPKAEKFLNIKKRDVLGKSALDLSRLQGIKEIISVLGGGLKECFRKELKISDNLILEITSVHMKVEEQRVSTLVILHNVTREKLADQMKSEFVTLAAHQLRTPISGVKWSLQTLLDGDLGELNIKQKEILEQALKTNNKVINLISDLLNVAEIEEGRYLNKMILADIEDIILVVIGDYEKEIEKKNIKVEIKKSQKEIPRAMIDIEKMKIAIRNIIDNAVRYSLGGGEIDILITLKEKERLIEVQIKDTGIGIPESQQKKLFSKFFRASNVMKVDTEGTGLGLYIAKNIIEAHDGKVWFESEENEGTAFYFSLPVKKKFGEFLTSDFY